MARWRISCLLLVTLLLITQFSAFSSVSAASRTSLNHQDLDRVDDDPIETRFRRLEEEFKSKFDRLNDDNKKLKDEVNELRETVKKQETEIQRLLGNQRNDKDVNKQDNAVVGIAEGGQRNGEGPQQEEDRVIATPPPTSCYDLAQLGNRISGFYLVMANQQTGKNIVTVYCDFSFVFNNPSYETRIGNVDVKSNSGVYFFVGRYSNYVSQITSGTVIPYEFARLNIGNAMNSASGVFTAPVSGRYQFNFVGRANAASTYVIFRLNGVDIAGGLGYSTFDNLAITATVSLQKGDRIDNYLYYGSIYDCGGCSFTQFTGILLEEDLVLS